MRRLLVLPVAVALTMLASLAAANDDARCVQQMLVDAYYDVGTIDGQIGPRTRRAAAELAETYPELGLPALAPDSYGEWCDIARAAPFLDFVEKRSVLGLIAWRDLKGPTSFWHSHERTSVCQTQQRGGRFDPLPTEGIAPFDPALVANITPIFGPAVGARSCLIPATFAGRAEIPVPVIDAEITGNYDGCDYCKFQPTYRFIGPAIAAYRAAPSPATAAPLRTFLVDWASANALSKNIWAPWKPNPVDYNVLKLVAPMVIAYSEVGGSMTPDEAEMVGRWLHRLVGEMMKSRWGDRQDNKSYLRSYVSLLWGLLTDDEKLRTAAYTAFDDALGDMRPDGSPVNDSMRGGSGLHYANRVATMLTAMATAAATDGVNLFAREIESRSLTNSANWAAVTASYPSLNMRYAKSCPDAGDGPGYDRETPDLGHMINGEFSSWALAYLLSPDAAPETAALITSHLSSSADPADVHAGGSLACYAAGIWDEGGANMADAYRGFDGYSCTFDLISTVEAVDHLATGGVTIRGGQVVFDRVAWASRLRAQGEAFTNWPLTFTNDKELVGTLPVYFLHERDDPPVLVQVGSMGSTFEGETPEGNTKFMIEQSDNNVGTFTLRGCRGR